MFKHLKIRSKLLLVMLSISLIPIILMGTTMLLKSRQALMQQSFSQLESVREIKKSQLDRFFNRLRSDMAVLLEMVSISRQNAAQKLQTVQENKKAQLERYFQERLTDIKVLSENDSIAQSLEQFNGAIAMEDHKIKGNAWHLVVERFGQELTQYKEKQNYYDLLLLTTDGTIAYTVEQRGDLGENVNTSKIPHNTLSEAFHQAMKTKTAVIRDFAIYPAAENHYLAFLATPVFRSGEVVGCLALALSAEVVNAIVQRQEGMSNTEETFVVGEDEGRISYRSDRVSKWSNRNVIDQEVTGPDINEALAGRSNIAIKSDPSGKLELGAYAPLQIPGLHWGIITSMALEEIITPKLVGQQTDFFTNYIIQNNYYDLLLIHPQGEIFYSVKHEADYGTNILASKFANSNLSQLVQTVLQNNEFTLSDYAPYPPANQAPAAFTAQSVLRADNTIELVVALRLSENNINRIMQQRAGMGNTGETYLVGSDKLMRSTTFLSPNTHSMTVSFAHPDQGSVDTESSRTALRGETGEKIIQDYQGHWVLSAYTPIQMGSHTWALLAEVDLREAFASVYTLQWMLAGLVLVVVLTVLWLVRRFIQNFMSPLSEINEHLKTLAQGQLSDTDIIYYKHDEVGEIVTSCKRLKEAIRSTIQQANEIAAGNYETQVSLLSYEDQLGNALTEMVRTLRAVIKQANAIVAGNYTETIQPLSDRDQLGNALSQMTKTLRELTAENALEDWLKTGQMQLAKELSGNPNITTLANNIINFLCHYLEAKVGLFYLVEATNKPGIPSEALPNKPEIPSETLPQQLKLLASYAYTWRKHLANRFDFGEGIVGQAALEQQPIILTQVPLEAIHIQSGLIDNVPRQVAVIPFLYEGKVKGVIELGFFNEIVSRQLEFLATAMPSIGIAVNTAESRTQLQELLQQSQVQTEELQSQTEELQSQQEELREANEELEERTRESERQQREVQEQNRVLEQSQQILQAKTNELELANKYKSEFLANMSHELRTPLNSLLILAQILMENKAGNLTSKQIEYAQTIHNAGNDLLTLINDILDLSKVESGKLEVHWEEVPLLDFIDGTRQKFQHVAEQKKILFQVDISEDLAEMVLHTDGQRLKQIINNLLSNAFKFTAKGQVKLEVKPVKTDSLAGTKNNSTGFAQHTNWLAITVADTGIGIPKDKQNLIFEAFQQADGTTSRRYGGTGLGLTISRQLAQLLGGKIVLDSGENQGSRFTLYLPTGTLKKISSFTSEPQTEVHSVALPSPQTEVQNLALLNSQTEVQSLASPVAEELETENNLSLTLPTVPGDDRNNLSPNDKVILIIEDDHKFSDILLELTHEKNFKCLLTEDGKTGLQLAEKYQPNAIILDISLPQMDGWTVMEKLKDNPKTRHIPVHFMSASHQDTEAKRMGAIGYLLKPVNIAELTEAFKKIEQFITRTVKHLLLIVDNSVRQQQILELIGANEVQFDTSATVHTALQQLHHQSYDCIILDAEVENNTGFKFLEQLHQSDQLAQIPVIIYTERELTTQEELLLQRYADNLTVKTVKTPECLLDEAMLFLHQLEANLSKEKRTILRRLHDKEAVLAHKKVLLVDDDMRNTFALTTILEEKEMEVLIAETGTEALALLNELPDVNLVLMDIMMPEMDGYETIRQIRAQARFRKLPIIALTAKAMKGDKTKCLEAGANDYLAKPVDIDKLMSLMRVWLYR